jgi:TatD DNase family protein
MLVDSHCHLDCLDLAKYNGDLMAALRAAAALDVGYILCAGIDLENSRRIVQLAQQYKNIVVSVGLHPTEHIDYVVHEDEVCALATDPLVVGIGETGLDYYHITDEQARAVQQQRFVTHIRAAQRLRKPLIIHSRDAAADILRILQQEQAAQVGGVFHCFAGDWEVAQQALAMNFYISFSGIITFKNAEPLRAVARQVPLDRILLETDAPFLAPMPYRGKPNEPAYLRCVAESMAALRGITYQELAAITTENFFRLFKSPVHKNQVAETAFK